jgi:hypothetical protein
MEAETEKFRLRAIQIRRICFNEKLSGIDEYRRILITENTYNETLLSYTAIEKLPNGLVNFFIFFFAFPDDTTRNPFNKKSSQ